MQAQNTDSTSKQGWKLRTWMELTKIQGILDENEALDDPGWFVDWFWCLEVELDEI